MSKPHVRWRTVVTSYPCEVCGVGPGDLCVTLNGAVKYEPHAPRARLAADNDWRNPEVECLHRGRASSPARVELP